jgi:hypothetical protein
MQGGQCAYPEIGFAAAMTEQRALSVVMMPYLQSNHQTDLSQAPFKRPSRGTEDRSSSGATKRTKADERTNRKRQHSKQKSINKNQRDAQANQSNAALTALEMEMVCCSIASWIDVRS